MTPEFRPEAPAAIASRSTRTTRAPASARNAAVAVPTMPPPTTTTSGWGATPDGATLDGGGFGPARRAAGDAGKRLEQPIDLPGSVVVRQPDAQHAAVRRETQPLDQAGRIEVTVPR